MRAGHIGEPIRIHARDRADTPLEFSWRGRRHRVREVIRLLDGGRYQLRTHSGMRCQVSQHDASWQIDQLLLSRPSLHRSDKPGLVRKVRNSLEAGSLLGPKETR